MLFNDFNQENFKTFQSNQINIIKRLQIIWTKKTGTKFRLLTKGEVPFVVVERPDAASSGCIIIVSQPAMFAVNNRRRAAARTIPGSFDAHRVETGQTRLWRSAFFSLVASNCLPSFHGGVLHYCENWQFCHETLWDWRPGCEVNWMDTIDKTEIFKCRVSSLEHEWTNGPNELSRYAAVDSRQGTRVLQGRQRRKKM